MASFRRCRSSGSSCPEALIALLVSVLLSSCSPHIQTASEVADTRLQASTPAPKRCLFQVQVDHEQRDGRFRMVLWQDTLGFRLMASDPIGRSMWIYDQQGHEGLWIDKRGKSWCQLEGDLALEIEDLGAIDVRVIPDLLFGRPVELPDGVVVEHSESQSILSREGIRVSWRRRHCEQADSKRPLLDHFEQWPQVCQPAEGIGE